MTDTNLMPTAASSNAIRLNFSDTEVRDFEPLPVGWYNAAITDYEMREVKQGDNSGKPYLNVEFTIQDGAYENRKVWTNAMLFEPALFTIAGILKALGHDVSGELAFDPQADLLDKALQIKLVVKKADEEKGYDASNEIKGFKPTGVAAGSTGSSLLP